MNQTLQLTDYIPQYVSLYYVDYRDDLDEHEDIQEECIRSNNMEKLYEKVYEWYEEQESSNMHDYLEETRKNMEADNLAGEFEEHEDEIRELIYDRNDSDPVKDLIRNSSVTNFFYSLGVEISGYLTGCSLRGESVAMACHKVRRALHLKKGQFDEKIEELVENATYGGELRIYFNAMFDRLISKEHPFPRECNGGHCRQPERFRTSCTDSAGHHFPFPKREPVCRFTSTLFLCQ